MGVSRSKEVEIPGQAVLVKDAVEAEVETLRAQSLAAIRWT
jgi:hypothetical protein